MTDKQKELLARFNRCSNSPTELQAFVKAVIMTGVFDNNGLDGDIAKVYHFNEADVLTDDILSKLKDGDIICVNQMSFVIKKSNLTTYYWIHGSHVAKTSNAVMVTSLEWESKDTKELTLTSVSIPVTE